MARNRSIDMSEMIQLAEDPAQYIKKPAMNLNKHLS